jgi:hypothetical protein
MSLLNKTLQSIIVLLLFICSSINISFAQYKSEEQLMKAILHALQYSDSSKYASVFVSSDTFFKYAYKNAPDTSETKQQAKLYIDNPDFGIGKDSSAFRQHCALFWDIVRKGDSLKIHWKDLIVRRFELEALIKRKDDTLYAATERMLGYLFVEDVLTRKTYTITLNDVIKVGNYWYGGAFNYIFEANTKDEFNEKLKAELIRISKGLPVPKDTIKQKGNDEEEDEEDPILKRRRLAIDRKCYFGMLDKEIPISLYVRYIKGDCPEKICSWDAILKYDENEWALQNVSKVNGEWVFAEEEDGFLLEVKLVDNKLIGTYTATAEHVEYDAKLIEQPTPKKLMQELEVLLENLMEK